MCVYIYIYIEREREREREKNEMGGACGSYGGGERCAQDSGWET